MTIRFIVEGQPIPKQRPRLGRKGQVYTPPKTAQWEMMVGYSCRLAMRDRQPFKRDVCLSVNCFRSDYRAVDLDNLVKAVSDGLNGVAYKDDNQVVELHAYLFKGCEVPRVEVAVSEIK